MSKQFVQKSFDLILLINNYYFEELPIKYMHKTFTELYYESLKQFSAESSVVKRTIRDLNSKCSTLHTYWAIDPHYIYQIQFQKHNRFIN